TSRPLAATLRSWPEKCCDFLGYSCYPRELTHKKLLLLKIRSFCPLNRRNKKLASTKQKLVFFKCFIVFNYKSLKVANFISLLFRILSTNSESVKILTSCIRGSSKEEVLDKNSSI